MFSLRKIDTNVKQNISPSKSAKPGDLSSPEKDLCYSPEKNNQFDNIDDEGFKLSLQSIKSISNSNGQNKGDWKVDLSKDIRQFNDSYQQQKESLVSRLKKANSFEERKPILDDFFTKIEQKTKQVQDSEGYQNLKQLQATNSFFKSQNPNEFDKLLQTSPQKSPLRKAKTQVMCSPTKPSKSGRQKENSVSPIKDQNSAVAKENSPVKRSRNKRNLATQQENIESPIKTSISPQKRSSKKNNMSSKKSLRNAISGESSESNTSPLKQQMRLFENPSSPMKEVNLENLEPEKVKEFEADKEEQEDLHLEQTNLLKSRKSCEKRVQDIQHIVEVDTPIMTFGQFMSGQNLGNQIQITNKTDTKRTFELSLDTFTETYSQSSKELFSAFVEDDLPFKGDNEIAANSEHLLKCWFIENPQTRTIEKSVLFELNPFERQTFLIIVKAPINFPKKKGNLLSHLILTHIPDEQDLESDRTEKRIGLDGKIERSQVSIRRELKVILCGKLENPTLFCLKGIKEDGVDASTIPLVARRRVDVQKFKLPFKNLSNTDTDFEFIFIKSVKSSDSEEDSFESLQHQVFECMTFFCQPAVLKVGNKAASILNVQLKVDQARLNSLPEEVLCMTLTKLLVARVKGSNLIQSFYVTINLLDQTADGMGR